MLLLLFDHDALPASELAKQTNISPQTASFHLAKLCQGQLTVFEKHGRHRYYRLASSEVAQALEALLLIAPDTKRVTTFTAPSALQFARTCYDHLAGQVGVKLNKAFKDLGYLALETDTLVVTTKGVHAFSKFGLDIALLQNKKRQFARHCLDWTERKYHLAGALGAALAQRLFELKWIVKVDGTRVVHVTPKGTEGLKRNFGVDL